MLEINLTSENFEEEVLKSEKPVLVDFWASWCGPCKMIAPIFEELAEEYKDEVKIGKVNVDEQASLAAKFRVTSIPTLILFKNGEITKSSVGFCSKSELEEMIK